MLSPGESECYEVSACEDLSGIEGEVKAVVQVEGAWNQLGEYRDKTWVDTSEGEEPEEEEEEEEEE